MGDDGSSRGLGIRAIARVFEVDPNTVWSWRVEAADPLEALSRHFLQDVYVEQVQMDALFALLSTVTTKRRNPPHLHALFYVDIVRLFREDTAHRLAESTSDSNTH